MTNILITGGLGFLGQHVTKTILENYGDFNIIILARSEKRIFLNELNDKRVTIIPGINIVNKGRIEKYFKNINFVIHIASMISFWHKEKEVMYETNVIGTRNIVELCLKNKVDRLIYVSSTAAIGGSQKADQPADESSNYDWKRKSDYDYGLSKYYAEKEIKKGVEKGLDAVVANPCTIIGYGDTKIFPLVETALKQIPVCFSGGSHAIDVRGLAKGLVSLISKGKAGERYLLVGEYHTQKEILTALSAILKTKPPVFVISSKILVLAIPILLLTDSFSKKRPKLTKTIVKNGLSPNYFSNMKSMQDLNWKPTYDLYESLMEAVKYYNEVIK